jgi:AP-3 complex subunit mu
LGKVLENVTITTEMPKTVLNMSLTVTQGKYSYDSNKKVLTWECGRVDGSSNKLANIRGNITMQNGCTMPESNPPLHVTFSINQLSVSGLKFGRLDIFGEVKLKLKLFKTIQYNSIFYFKLIEI